MVRSKILSFLYHMPIASRIDREMADLVKKCLIIMIAGFSSAHEFLGSPESVMGFMCKKDRKVAPTNKVNEEAEPNKLLNI